MPLTKMPFTGAVDAKRVHRQSSGPEAAWPDVYPATITTIGGTYGSHYNTGVFTADGTYNDHPIYKNGAWSIYYRTALNMWVLDFNDVSEDWDGTVGIQTTLFHSDV